LDYNSTNVSIYANSKQQGFSVRCIKDNNNPIQTVSDIDGNVYKIATIGSQVWMTENLKTTKYRDGTAIPNVTSAATWPGLTTGAYCNYNNDTSKASVYGRLYNFYPIVDSRNLCPTGWHVPSLDEWTTLITFLGGSNIAGGKMKEVGITHWNSPNTGADNSSGFNALPSGYRRNDNGIFDQIGTECYWWSNSFRDSSNPWFYILDYNSAAISIYANSKQQGFSVRCIKD
jgi:uncharacterized protein (TIGR02145 family)